MKLNLNFYKIIPVYWGQGIFHDHGETFMNPNQDLFIKQIKKFYQEKHQNEDIEVITDYETPHLMGIIPIKNHRIPIDGVVWKKTLRYCK